jgi:hypothetical protein
MRHRRGKGAWWLTALTKLSGLKNFTARHLWKVLGTPKGHGPGVIWDESLRFQDRGTQHVCLCAAFFVTLSLVSRR